MDNVEEQYWMGLIFKPLRLCCIENRLGYVVEITAWARENSPKPLSVNTHLHICGGTVNSER